MDTEKIKQFQMIEQEANQLNQQSELIDQNLKEMTELNESLNEIEKKETKELLINIGKKIYIPVEIKSKDLTIEIGNKSYVKKSILEIKEILQEQITKLSIAKSQVSERLLQLENEVSLLINSEHKCNCADENCNHECGDECQCK